MQGSGNPAIIELARLPERVAALTEGQSDEALRRRPAEMEWSAMEIAGHLRDAARIYHERLFLAVAHDRPFLAPYDEVALARERNYQAMPLDAILSGLRSWRDETVALLSDLPVEAWERVAVHGETGEMSIIQLVAHMIEHEADHLRGLTQLLA